MIIGFEWSRFEIIKEDLPGDIFQPRTRQVMCMLRKIEDQEDPKAPFQGPIAEKCLEVA